MHGVSEPKGGGGVSSFWSENREDLRQYLRLKPSLIQCHSLRFPVCCVIQSLEYAKHHILFKLDELFVTISSVIFSKLNPSCVQVDFCEICDQSSQKSNQQS